MNRKKAALLKRDLVLGTRGRTHLHSQGTYSFSSRWLSLRPVIKVIICTHITDVVTIAAHWGNEGATDILSALSHFVWHYILLSLSGAVRQRGRVVDRGAFSPFLLSLSLSLFFFGECEKTTLTVNVWVGGAANGTKAVATIGRGRRRRMPR